MFWCIDCAYCRLFTEILTEEWRRLFGALAVSTEAVCFRPTWMARFLGGIFSTWSRRYSMWWSYL